MGMRKYSTPINFITFQSCWFGCVLGAANDLGWIGPLLVLITAPLQAYFLTEKQWDELLFIIICGFSGFLLETLMITGGVYVPVGQVEVKVSPLWMTALWFNFGPLVSISLSWLKGRYLLAGFLGGLAGPIAYWGGEKLGALTVAEIFIRGYFPLILLWTLVLPSLVYMHKRVVRIENIVNRCEKSSTP